MSILHLKTRVLPGGRIEVQAPGLVEGQEVTLRVVVRDEVSEERRRLLEDLDGLLGGPHPFNFAGESPKRRTSDILANYPGGRLFKTAAEVDQYIKEERDSWGD